MASIFKFYQRLLHERPFVTNVITSSVFMGTGDLISQSILQQRDQINLEQTARFATAGLIFVGPAARGLLVLIDKIFGSSRSAKNMVRKVLFDQGVIAPIFCGANISVITILKGVSLKEVRDELERSYLGLLSMNYMYWPFVSMINFYFVPLTYRVVVGSTAALIWNTAVSYKLTRVKPAAITYRETDL